MKELTESGYYWVKDKKSGEKDVMYILISNGYVNMTATGNEYNFSIDDYEIISDKLEEPK